VDNSTALLAGILGSNRETIETHPVFPSDFKLNMKSYTQHNNKCITGKQTPKGISINIHTQRITQHREFESISLY
jgi:hypothetical protein